MRGGQRGGEGGIVEKINKILKISAVGEVFRLRNAGKEPHEWLEKI